MENKSSIQKLNRRDNIEKILSAAEETFGEYGFVGASISKIATLAGIPKSNVVYYFPTKETLYRTVVEDIFEIWRAAADSIKVEVDPKQALSHYIDMKLDISRQRPNGSKVWANEIMQGAPVVHDYLEVELREWTENRMHVIDTWIEMGKIKPVNSRYFLYTIWATTQHFADFRHQIITLNNGENFSDEDWLEVKQSVKQILLSNVCY